jgi:MoaA/NifB/PqqE/SkfB family radical SAM enzyme
LKLPRISGDIGGRVGELLASALQVISRRQSDRGARHTLIDTLSRRHSAETGGEGRAHPLAAWDWAYNERNARHFSHGDLFRPIMLIVETISICNNACVICPYPIHTRKKETMSLDLFRSIIEHYVAIGGGHISLTPMLGEIFLDKHLPERLELLAAEPAIKGVSAHTNATMARRYSDAEMKDVLARFRRIYISVYGMDAEEYLLMTKKDEYDLARRQIVRIISLAPEGAVAIGMRNLRQWSFEAQTDWVAALAAEAGKPAPPILSVGEHYANWGDITATPALPLDGRWAEPKTNSEQCLLPLSALQVLADGTVSFCSCADYNGSDDLMLGNIREHDFAHMLRGEKYARLWNWREHGVPKYCAGCGFHRPMSEAKNPWWTPDEPLNLIGA